MVVVTGTGRSGTSMWMQILQAAGLQVVGERFPLDWEAHAALNPRGFYESALCWGINSTTNPDPRTGALLEPETCGDLAVKIWIPGVMRTHRRFLGRVVVSYRDWRDYLASHQALQTAFGQQGQGRSPHERWFREHLGLLQDAARRRYPVRFVRFGAVLDEPERVVPEVMEWLQGSERSLDGARAVAAVAPSLRSVRDRESPEDLELVWVEALDALQAFLSSGLRPSVASLGPFRALGEQLPWTA